MTTCGNGDCKRKAIPKDMDKYRRGYCVTCWNAFKTGINMGQRLLRREIAELLGVGLEERVEQVEYDVHELGRKDK